MAKQYGFYTEKYSETLEVETLMTGDGKAQFTDVHFDDETASIGISYGIGEGIGTLTKHDKIMDEDMLIKWQIKFENQQSIDSMIETLLRVKNLLASNQIKVK